MTILLETGAGVAHRRQRSLMGDAGRHTRMQAQNGNEPVLGRAAGPFFEEKALPAFG